jgi:hypothetical protein
VAKNIKVSQEIVANFPLAFETNLTFDGVDALPDFMDLFLGSEKTKLALEFRQCDRETTASAQFAIS